MTQENISQKFSAGEHFPEVLQCVRSSCEPDRSGGMPAVHRIPPLTDDERAALMLEVRREGETSASRRLGLSRNTIARALAKLRLRPGSVLLIRHALHQPKSTAAPTALALRKHANGGRKAP